MWGVFFLSDWTLSKVSVFPVERQRRISRSSLGCNGRLMLTVPGDAAENLASIRSEKCHCQLFHSWQGGQNLSEKVLARS